MRPGADTAIGVDVGGSRIRVGRIARDGSLQERRAEPVERAKDAFAAQLLRLVIALRSDTDRAVGIGIPGRVDARAGVIRSAGYLEIAGLDLPRIVERETSLPVRIENDATMALLSEARACPEGTRGLILMLTVGTGIGGALLEDGAPWHGGGFAGQFGHIVVAKDGPPCNCGRQGCVETFSSGTALARLVTEAELPEGTRAAELFERANRGDKVCSHVLGRWARPMQRAIESLVAMADPWRVIVGGGLGTEMVLALETLPARSDWFPLPVEAATLGDKAGVIGAGLRGLQAIGTEV